MLILAMAAILLGVVLGLRFKVLILLPAAVVAVAIMVTAGSIEHSSFSTVAVDAVLVLAGLQMGYLAGAIAGALMGVAPQSEAPWQESASSITKSTMP
jgi:hypothetical protein